MWARAGMRVLLLEAGGDDEGFHYSVPAFHGEATEDEALRWDYFVRHYSDEERARRDPKFVADRGGIWYPRAGTLGGCTAHNAMITIAGPSSDWDAIAGELDDQSWSGEAMRGYFERLERNTYVPAANHSLSFSLMAAWCAISLFKKLKTWVPISSSGYLLATTSNQKTSSMDL